MIPSKIHLTAPTKRLTTEENRVIARNKAILLDWEFSFYDNADNEHVMQVAFPEFFDQFRAIKRGVVQADIMRCVYLYQFGGWYLDTDYRLLRRLEGEVCALNSTNESTPSSSLDLLSQKLILPISGIPEKDRHFICNSILASEKGHPFWRAFIEHLFSNDKLILLDEHSVEGLTGPLGLSHFYLENKDRFPDVCLPLKQYFHPRITTWGFSYDQHPDNYGVHWCWGSWRSKRLPRKIKNIITRKITSFL